MPGIQHLQMRLDGLIGSNQTWSVNPKFQYVAGGGAAVPTQAVMDGWAAALAAYGDGLLPMADLCSSAVSVTGVTCSFVNAAGTSLVISKAILAAPVKGRGSASMPPQSSVVTTLQTNVPGRRARGRLYWPLLAAGIDPDTLRLSAAAQSGIADATGTWLHALEQAWPGPEQILLAVVSSVGATATPVTSVRVGDVIDTQRRRRDQLLENYVTQALP